MPKLYEVPRDTWISFHNPYTNLDLVVKFHHIDGMYSYCTDRYGSVIHLGASLEVDIIKNPQIEMEIG